jgi:hypothetical protein
MEHLGVPIFIPICQGSSLCPLFFLEACDSSIWSLSNWSFGVLNLHFMWQSHLGKSYSLIFKHLLLHLPICCLYPITHVSPGLCTLCCARRREGISYQGHLNWVDISTQKVVGLTVNVYTQLSIKMPHRPLPRTDGKKLLLCPEIFHSWSQPKGDFFIFKLEQKKKKISSTIFDSCPGWRNTLCSC